ncbi:hypothetical protein DR999_PMT03662 [Platysternon megacephalum]|uniref:Uncharacterized protein n=1 Tax=Platysternon megacephalum TaxID=55544 RepID=A0A4D9F559_9SAUR|nr:hypothetical protein DR999_PMT03662 [Platysternon megacephalum]
MSVPQALLAPTRATRFRDAPQEVCSDRGILYLLPHSVSRLLHDPYRTNPTSAPAPPFSDVRDLCTGSSLPCSSPTIYSTPTGSLHATEVCNRNWGGGLPMRLFLNPLSPSPIEPPWLQGK